MTLRIAIALFALVCLATGLSAPTFAQTATPASNIAPKLHHFLGGFSIDTPERVANAAAVGIKFDLTYGKRPQYGDATYAALQSHNMGLIPGRINDYVIEYGACQQNRGCDESAILLKVRNYLETQRGSPLVSGYWILDDWKLKMGSARDFLVKVNALIHEITPGRPSICGFGGGVDTIAGEFYWNDGIAANFSPEGCDMVGLYLYGEDGAEANHYDWKMPKALAAAFESLKQRGWDKTKSPLVGIPQAFGGDLGGSEPRKWVKPTAASIEMQARTYCELGAIGVIYYSWNEQTTSSTVLPTNSDDIRTGILNGNAACRAIWGVP